jgi:hypothetical protein
VVYEVPDAISPLSSLLILNRATGPRTFEAHLLGPRLRLSPRSSMHPTAAGQTRIVECLLVRAKIDLQPARRPTWAVTFFSRADRIGTGRDG